MARDDPFETSAKVKKINCADTFLTIRTNIYSIDLNRISENMRANSNRMATEIPVEAMIFACSRINSVVTLRQPSTCNENGVGLFTHGFRWPPYASWQHDSGMAPCQSWYDSMPQHFKRICVSSQANVTGRWLPYNLSVEYISWRIVCTTFSRNT